MEHSCFKGSPYGPHPSTGSEFLFHNIVATQGPALKLFRSDIFSSCSNATVLLSVCSSIDSEIVLRHLVRIRIGGEEAQATCGTNLSSV